jgi:hypothetical protein
VSFSGRQSAKKHALREHTCPECMKRIKGNAYYRHEKSCQNKFINSGGRIYEWGQIRL